MRHEIVSTSVPDHWVEAIREELLDHGCHLYEEANRRVRIEWPTGSVLDTGLDKYVLPSGWTVRLGGPAVRDD